LVVRTLAQAASITIDILATFDYPGTGNSTLPQKINDAGEIAGYYKDASGVTRGFVRLRNGNFSAPIVDPNWDGFLTSVRAINNHAWSPASISWLISLAVFSSPAIPIRISIYQTRLIPISTH
jgi:hypothetical protein